MALRQHRYRITVEPIAAPRPDEPLRAPFIFEAGNHDDILRIADRMREKTGLPPDEAASLAIGMKLFNEIMLMHRDDPLFAELRPHMRQFVAALKARNRAGEEAVASSA